MIRRTINIPVLVLSVLVLAAGAGGCYFLREWQLARLSQLLLAQARQEEARSEWTKAAQHLERYLRLQPHNQAARAQLALAFAKAAGTLEEKQRAVALHFRALASELGNQENELRLGLAELLLETGRLLEAENEAQRVLASAPQQPRASRTFALARYFQWRSGALSSQRPAQLELLKSLEEALARNPGDISLSEITATLYREFPEIVAVHRAGLNQLSRQQAADRLIEQVVQHQPRDAKAYLSRHVYRAKYALPGHEEDLAKALALAPDNPTILIVAARVHCQAAKAEYARPLDQPDPAQRRNPAALDRELAAARRLLERLIDKDLARTVEPHLLLGDVRAMQGDLDAGIRVWRRALAVHDKPIEQVACHARIADHLLGSSRVDESLASLQAIDLVLAKLGGTVSRQHHLALMQAQGLRRATYFLSSARYSEAVGEVQQAIARQPQLQPDQQTSYRAWDLMGRGFAGLEDWTDAATAFDRAANFDPQAVASRLGAARCWLSAGRADLAVDRAEQALLVQQSPEALIILVAAQLQIQAGLPTLERSWERTQSALAALERLDPAAVEAPWRIDFLKADYFALRSPTAENPNYGAAAASDVVRLAESKYEKGSQFWFEACLAYERLGRTDDAQRAWETLNQLPDGKTQATIAASRRAAVHDNFAQAARILEKAGATALPTAKRTFRQELIRIAQAKQDLSQLKQLLLAELLDRPRDVGVLCRLAELELRAGELNTLAGYEKKLAAAGPLGEVWALYFHSMRLYSSAKDAGDPALQEALALQAQLATLRPNWSESYALRGAIEQRLGRLAPAAAAYEQAIALGERRYVVFEQLIACLDQLNRTADVEKYLARMETYLPSSQRLTEIATQHQFHRDQPDKAVELARNAVAQRPGDLAAQLWLGRMLLLTNQLEDARQVFEQATQQSPQDVRSWNGLFTYCLHAGDKSRARHVLDAVRENAKLDPVDLDLFLGQAYLRLGESAEALRLFAALKEQAPNRADIHLQLARLYLETDREKAREFLQQAIELDPKLAQARWLLAAIVAAGGSEAELAQAEQLLDGAGDGAAVEDRRVRALLLAQHGDADGLVRAVQILEQIIAEGADTSNDHMLLAQFYERQAQATPDPAEAAAKLKAARDQLVNLASRSRAQVGDVAVLIAFLLRQEEKLEAGVWLDRLEERVRSQSRDDVRAIAQLIDLRIKHGTVALAEPWIARLESTDRDPVRPLVARVKYLVALGKIDEVEPLIEAKAKSALDAIVDSHFRTRIARAIGDLYLLANVLPGAERWYRVVLREDKDQFPLLALTLMRQHRAREAIRLCEAATEHDSSSRPAVMLTQILLEAGGKAEHLEMAEPMLEAALQKFPEDVNLLYGVGMLRVLADRYPEAIPLLRKVIALNPRHVPALNNLAVLVAETPDQRDEALKLVEQAIELRGQQATLLDTKGAILVLVGRSGEALSLLEAASRGKNSDPRHKFHLALAYLDMGAAQQAGQMLSDALAGKLDNHILTPTDRKSLTRLQSEFATPPPEGSARLR